MKRVFEDGLSLITGAGIGTVLALLLDPSSGDKRRAQIAESTRGAVRSAEGAASDYGHRASTYARQAGRSAYATGHDAWDAGEEWLEDVADRVSGRLSSAKKQATRQVRRTRRAAVGGAKDAKHAATSAVGGLFASLLGTSHAATEAAAKRAKDARQAAEQKADYLRRRAGKAAGRARGQYRDLKRDWVEPEHHGAVSDLVGGWALVGLGAGLAYLLDTQAGPQRRQWAAERASSLAHAAGDQLAGTAKHVADRAKGVVAEASKHVNGGGPTDDETLTARVRSELGHVTDLGDLTLEVHDGRVTLSGNVPADHRAAVMEKLNSIDGVRGVEDHLEAAT